MEATAQQCFVISLVIPHATIPEAPPLPGLPLQPQNLRRSCEAPTSHRPSV